MYNISIFIHNNSRDKQSQNDMETKVEVFFMAANFKNSVTKDNLMRAFAGESQARNRYIFAAQQAKKAKLQVIESVFTYTANQETAHARVFYKHLKELAGETIYVDGGYPVDISDDVGKLLRMAQHNEYQEHDDVYRSFGEKAKEEGFLQVANSFFMIAEIEKIHGDRFGRFADLLDNKGLFKENGTTKWICLNCGYVCEGDAAPDKCPVCYHDKGYFIRFKDSPFIS